jgi:hypothetical protein
MPPDETLYLLTCQARPHTPDPAGCRGADIVGYFRADSGEEAEKRFLSVLPGEGWIPEREIHCHVATRADIPEVCLPYFEQALAEGACIVVGPWDANGAANKPAPSAEPSAPSRPSVPEEPDELTAMMISSAEQIVRYGAESHILLDFSEDSLNRLDRLIVLLHPDGAILDSTAIVYAAYVGEVLRRNLGGEWKHTEEHGLHFEGTNFKAGPLKWTRDKFADPAGNSLAAKYRAVKSLIQGGDAALSTVPPPPVPVPASAEEEDQEDDEDVLALQRAPLVVCLMVASAEGTVEPKDVLKWRELLRKSTRHPNRLFKLSAGAAQVNFCENVEQLLETGLVSWPLFLLQTKAAAERISPEDSSGYCRALYDLGETVAKSSGGFWGFRGVSKREKAALRIVAQSLGVA